MTFIDDFSKWTIDIKPDLDHVYRILCEKMSDEAEALVSDLQDAESWGSRCGYLLAEANSFLHLASQELMPEKTGTEFERKTLLDSKVAIVRKYRDRIESLSESIRQRLMLGMSILRYQTQFAEHKANPTIKKDGFRGQTVEDPF